MDRDEREEILLLTMLLHVYVHQAFLSASCFELGEEKLFFSTVMACFINWLKMQIVL
jgi:hypothetical protein